VADCGIKIARDDNFYQHIRSHLRPPTKGKRNMSCTWAYMKDRLRASDPENSVRIIAIVDRSLRDRPL
jgi:hypothetical protein